MKYAYVKFHIYIVHGHHLITQVINTMMRMFVRLKVYVKLLSEKYSDGPD